MASTVFCYWPFSFACTRSHRRMLNYGYFGRIHCGRLIKIGQFSSKQCAISWIPRIDLRQQIRRRDFRRKNGCQNMTHSQRYTFFGDFTRGKFLVPVIHFFRRNHKMRSCRFCGGRLKCLVVALSVLVLSRIPIYSMRSFISKVMLPQSMFLAYTRSSAYFRAHKMHFTDNVTALFDCSQVVGLLQQQTNKFIEWISHSRSKELFAGNVKIITRKCARAE